jgi:hypothetical protein
MMRAQRRVSVREVSWVFVVCAALLAGVLLTSCGADDTAEGGGGNSNLCGEGTVFLDGKCVIGGCPDGQVPISGECKPNPCGEGTVFVNDRCVVDTSGGGDVLGGDGTSGTTDDGTSGSTSGSTSGDTSGSTSGDTSGTTSGDTSGTGECLDSQRRCNGNTVEVCRLGQYQSETTCAEGSACIGGACQVEGEVLIGSCGGGPVPLVLDGPTLNGTTNVNTVEPLNWSQNCTQKYNKEAGLGGTFLSPIGPQNVYAIDFPDSRYAEIKLEPLPGSPTYFALYAMGECSQETSYTRRACTGSITQGGTATVSQLWAKGRYYFMADSFGSDAAALGDYTISAKSIAPKACNTSPSGKVINAAPTVVQLNELGAFTHEANTSLGSSETIWRQSSTACREGETRTTSGNERIYALSLRERKTVQITLTTLNVSGGADQGVGLYLRIDCGDEYYGSGPHGFTGLSGVVDACSQGDQATVATLTQTMEPAMYYIFVDEIAKAISRDYRLEVVVLD